MKKSFLNPKDKDLSFFLSPVGDYFCTLYERQKSGPAKKDEGTFLMVGNGEKGPSSKYGMHTAAASCRFLVPR